MNLRYLFSGLLVLAFAFAGTALFHAASATEAWAQDQSETHTAVGVVQEVDREKKTVTLAHGPVESLGWQGMTMAFTVEDAALLEAMPVGREVQFEFMKHGSMFMIVSAK